MATSVDREGKCRDFRPRLCGTSSFFRRRKKKQKSRWDTCDCVPNPATLFGMRENKRSFSHCRDFRPLDCPNKTTARAVPGRNYKLLPALATNSPPDYSRSASRPALRNKVNLRVYQTTPTQKFFAGLFQKMRCLLFQKSKSPLRVLRAKGSFGIIG